MNWLQRLLGPAKGSKQYQPPVYPRPDPPRSQSGYRPRDRTINPAPPPRPNASDVKVLKQGTPVVLYGECGGCHTIVESDVKQARKVPGVAKPHLQIDCPTCQYPIDLWPNKPRELERTAGEKLES